MLLQIIADLHGTDISINVDADYFILLGDIHGRFFWEIKDFVMAHPEKEDCFLGLLGNHDSEDFKINYSWVHWIHSGEIININEKRFGFLPWMENSPKIMFTEPPDIIFSHAPVLDFTNEIGEVHKGKAEYQKYIEENKPQLWFHGHIHQSLERIYKGCRIVSVYKTIMCDI